MAFYDPKTRPENLPPRKPREDNPSKWRPSWVKPPGQWIVWRAPPKGLEGWIAWIIESVIFGAFLYWFTVEIERPWLRPFFAWLSSR